MGSEIVGDGMIHLLFSVLCSPFPLQYAQYHSPTSHAYHHLQILPHSPSENYPWLLFLYRDCMCHGRQTTVKSSGGHGYPKVKMYVPSSRDSSFPILDRPDHVSVLPDHSSGQPDHPSGQSDHTWRALIHHLHHPCTSWCTFGIAYYHFDLQ